MKPTKFMKKAFAFGLALSLVVTGSGVNGTTASAAKKPKLGKRKVTLITGKTTTLTVKNANKKVKWSTSNKKVARVTKKSGKKKETATIKALKKGKAVITAKVGKKKLTCKVTVKKPVPNFKSVSVDKFDSSCLVLKLKKKDASLSETNLAVTTKVEKAGTFNNKINVSKVVAVNSKTYRVYLEEGVYNGTYVQVTSGVSKASTQRRQPFYAEKDSVFYACERGDVIAIPVDDYDDEDDDIKTTGYFSNAVGNVKLSVKKGKLPAGLTLDTKESTIKGIPTEVGTSTVTLEAKDELGRKATMQATFGIYDNTSITVAGQSQKIALNDDMIQKAAAQTAANASTFDADKNSAEYYVANYKIAPKGGSGNYTFTLNTPDNEEVRLSTDVVADDATKAVTKRNASSTVLRIPYSIKEGTHKYEVTVADVMDPNRTCTATITVKVEPYYNLTGVVKSINGLSISGTYAYLIPSKAKSFQDAIRVAVRSNQDGVTNVGTYDAEVPADTYTVKVSGDVLYQMNGSIKLTKADKIAKITVPVKFYSVSAKATYSNKANSLRNKQINLETTGRQYENDGFYRYAVSTDDQGNFSIALPTNTFVAYMRDEKGNRKYFNKKIAIRNKDVTIGSMQASIARYSVEGLVFNGTSVDPATQFADTLKEKTLYFYNALGVCTTVQTDERGAYKVFLEGDSAYTVRAYFGGSARTLGTVTVEKANQTGIDLRYTNETEIAAAQEYPVTALGTEAVINSTGNNDIMWRFTPAAAATYQFAVSTAVNEGVDVYVYDPNYQTVNCKEEIEKKEDGTKLYKYTAKDLSPNVAYYVKVIPYGKENDNIVTPQAQGAVKLTVTQLALSTPGVPTTGGGISTNPGNKELDLTEHDYASVANVLPRTSVSVKLNETADYDINIETMSGERVYELYYCIEGNGDTYITQYPVDKDGDRLYSVTSVSGENHLTNGEYTLTIYAKDADGDPVTENFQVSVVKNDKIITIDNRMK